MRSRCPEMAIRAGLIVLMTATTILAVAAAGPAKGVRAVIDATSYVNRELADCGLQKAIDEAHAKKGGVVKLPEGTFLLRRGLVLKDGVELVGAGMDKTVLMPARQVLRLNVVKDGPQSGKVFLKDIPDGLDVGSAVVTCRQYPPSWYGSPRPAFVTAVDRAAETLTISGPYGLSQMKAGRGVLTFGVTAALERSIKKGDTEIVLKNAGLFKPGDELAIGEPGNESMRAHAFVKEVRGNTLVLEAPTRIAFQAWPDKKKIGNKKINALIWALFPMIHGAHVKNAAVSDLTVKGRGFGSIRPMNTRYTLSGIHLFNAVNVKFERVAVRDWPSDGFSLQTGKDCIVVDCEATGCLGNGFHPGTGLKTTVFERCLAARNGTGLYFCWHNKGHVMRQCKFIENRDGGITGLGNPSDRQNVIEECLIARNGAMGIAINGGRKSGNVIRNNTIENNSVRTPGKHAGIELFAKVEDARNYTITGNTIRDTQEKPTQWIGIHEKNGMRRKKVTYADENVVKGNTFSGHKVADVVVSGAKTTVAQPGARVMKAEELPQPKPKKRAKKRRPRKKPKRTR